MCSQLQRLEAGEGTHVTKYYYMTKLRYGADFLKYAFFAIVWFAISVSLIFASLHANIRMDVLLNVTRVGVGEASNVTVYEDLSNCTTSSSLEHCKQLRNGSWYIETNNSVNGKVLKYSYSVVEGEIVSCKELRGEDMFVTSRHRLPCSYYVAVFFSTGRFLSAILVVMFAGPEQEKVTYYNVLGMGFSWISFLMALMLAGIFVLRKVKDLTGNALESDAMNRTFPALMHFYLLAVVGWMSVFSQKYFMVKEKKREGGTTWQHFKDLVTQWGPFCAYFPAFYFINWLLSYVIPLFPYSLMPACEESCWLTQKTLLLSFAAPVSTFALFNMHGGIMLKYHDSRLQCPHLRDNFLLLSKLFYAMVFVWFFGAMVNCVESFVLLRFVFNMVTLCEGFLFLVLGIHYENFKSQN